MTLAEAPAYGTPDWVAWRRNGLGASDLSAILGLDPYRTEHELWEQKTGKSPDFDGNAKTRWGHRLERVGLDVWMDRNPAIPVPNTEPFTRPEYPHLWATPDALARPVGIEVKVTSAWVHPPERVRVQCLAQMGLADLERIDVVRLSFDEDPAIFRVDRDDAAIADILAAGEAWYVRHVIEGIEPPMAEGEHPADERQAALSADLRRVKRTIEQLERQERAIRDDIIASVAGQGVITGPGWRIEVRRSRGAVRTGWKEVASAYRTALEPHMAAADLEAIEGMYQTQGKPTTSVYPTWDEETA
jgi:putative phage-type endonuclease